MKGLNSGRGDVRIALCEISVKDFNVIFACFSEIRCDLGLSWLCHNASEIDSWPLT
jgi:hypothetical protein